MSGLGGGKVHASENAGAFWGRFLVSFRSGGAERDAVDPSARVANRAMRFVLLPLARAYAGLTRRLSSSEAFVPTVNIEWVNRLESSWRAIRGELDQLQRGFDLPALIDVIPGERYVTDARWKMFMFRYHGRRIDRNCSLCPRTAALLDEVPGLISANFSVLEPGARIAAHSGFFAGVLRYHLGLVVPSEGDRCGLRVGGETRHWREGASLLFDDTRPHEAWNLTDEDRIVLLLDVKRELPVPFDWINRALLACLSRIVMVPLARVDRMVPSDRHTLV